MKINCIFIFNLRFLLNLPCQKHFLTIKKNIMRKKLLGISKVLAVFLAFSIFLTSCASSTRIVSEPPGAKVYLDGEYVGQTPYTMRDTKIVGSCTDVTLKKEGYKEFYTSICRNEKADVGAIIGGLLFLVPFLWTMKYKPVHRYELIPDNDK